MSSVKYLPFCSGFIISVYINNSSREKTLWVPYLRHACHPFAWPYILSRATRFGTNDMIAFEWSLLTIHLPQEGLCHFAFCVRSFGLGSCPGIHLHFCPPNYCAQRPISKKVYGLITQLSSRCVCSLLDNSSGHGFAYVTTAVLSWHMQNNDMIASLMFKLKSKCISYKSWKMSLSTPRKMV